MSDPSFPREPDDSANSFPVSQKPEFDADIVRWIFQEKVKGSTPDQIARTLRLNEVPNPDAPWGKSDPWTPDMVSRLFKRMIYKGKWRTSIPEHEWDRDSGFDSSCPSFGKDENKRLEKQGD